ncbi:MAG: hypothetical protein PVG56_05530, partial [Anaerolineae bacterium]
MDPQPLYFNGVNGLEGGYGLEPMTSEQLAAHILGTERQPPRRRQILARKLERDNTDKILRIVRLLAESNAQDVQRDAAWHSEWLGTLALELAELLLPEEHSEPDRLKELEYRLARHTVDKIVHIVELLARGRAEELAV